MNFGTIERQMEVAQEERELLRMPKPNVFEKVIEARRAARKAEQLSRFAERLAAWRPGSTRSVGGFIP